MERPRKRDAENYLSNSLLQHIRSGNKAEVFSILQDIHPRRLTNGFGAILLHVAASCGNVWLARHLIDLGVNVNAPDDWQKTPLMLAVKNDQTEVVKVLVEANADIFVPDQFGGCVLGYMIRRSENTAKALLERVTSESLRNSRHVESKVFHDDCPLYFFIPMQNAEVTRVLLQKGSPVNAQKPFLGTTSLHMAVEQLDLENVKVLLQFGAYVHLKDCNGDTPLACLQYFSDSPDDQKKVLEIFNLLMEAGAAFSDLRKILARRLLEHGDRNVIRGVLAKRIDLHFEDDEGVNTLQYLAQNKNDVLAELRDADFDVETRTKNSKRTMLHLAASCGNPSSIEFLLDRGADANAKCSDDCTPIDYVINKYGDERLDIYVKCIEILLARGADPRLVKKKCWLPVRLGLFVQSVSRSVFKIMVPVFVHLSLVEVSGQDIGRNMRNALSIPEFQKIFNSKKIECEEMKLIVVGKSVTLLDFLVASDKDISLYARTYELTSNSFSAVKKDRLDPCYQRKLSYNLLKLTKCINLRKKAVATIDNVFIKLYNISVCNVAEQLVGYLEDRSIKKLCTSLDNC